jgi:hypothetical protein
MGTSTSRGIVAWLCVAVSTGALLTIAHFAYGAHVYDDDSRYHVVAPALFALVLSLSVACLYAWRPSRLALWALALIVAVPFVGIFGLFHGGFGHALKLIVYFAGASPERLETIFDSPDFAVPNDAVFEITGTATLVASLVVAHHLVRLLRAAHLGA